MSKARERNWSKARLSGLTFNMSSFTPSELLIIKQIQALRVALLANWDKNTEEHLGIVLEPYQCGFCRRRFGEKNFGNKIFKESTTEYYICFGCIKKMS